MRTIIVIFVGLFALFFYRYYRRSFYRFGNNQSITFWRNAPESAYLIQGYYFGVLPPDGDRPYVRLDRNIQVVDLIWMDRDTSWLLLNRSLLECKINTVQDEPPFIRCSERECGEDMNLMDPLDNGKYKAGVQSLQIYVNDGYGRMRSGSTVL
jgi:hypothetical protein